MNYTIMTQYEAKTFTRPIPVTIEGQNTIATTYVVKNFDTFNLLTKILTGF